MKNRIGIVVTLWGEDFIRGYLAESIVSLELSIDGQISVKQDIERKYFRMDLSTQQYTVGKEINHNQAISIEKELKNIGFEKATLVVDKLY